VRFAVQLWLWTRAAIVAAVAASVYLWPAAYTASGSVAAPLSFVDGLCPWDCRCYADIAAEGYRYSLWTNFWPLLPLVARPLVWLHVPRLWAVVLVSNAASLGAYVAIYRVFEIVEDEAAARWGLTLFAAYPFSFFFASGYTESLMVLGGAGAMWLALRGRHLWAGAALGVAALARAPSLIAGLGLLVLQLRETGGDVRRLLRRPAFLGLILPIAILFPWFLYQFIRYHDFLFSIHIRRSWGWHAYLDVVTGMRRARESRMLLLYPFLTLPTLIGSLALLWRPRWWPLASMAVPLCILYWAMGAFGLGRYSASLWPAFLPLGVWLSRRPSLQPGVVAASAILQGLLLQLFAHAYELQ
jgi:hypothetical protein